MLNLHGVREEYFLFCRATDDDPLRGLATAVR